jgi:penicillin-insensitive murein DD-endopeptidase
MACPPGASECKGQSPQGGGEGCGKGDLAYWFKESIIHPKPPEKPAKPATGITMAALPPDCKKVLNAPDQKQ